MNLIAVHAIQRRDAKGLRDDIAPRAAFEASGDEAAYLLRVGAATKAPGQVIEGEAEPVSASDDADVELTSMTKAQLVQFAKDHDIEIDASAKKDEIVDTLDAALRADDDLV